ncbi:MAG: ribulose-phosphate 3-epimerase [Synergistaceae bacterium]|jgi:ribulose-phosphate 3-epimerase|nr:ribulose-phosphate 3-epimerase [Synergistaceae bacterium]
MLGLKGNKACILAPSILSADPLAVGDSIRSLGGEGDWIHVDVADGHFVPNLTFGPMMVSTLRRAFPDAFIDVHLMVTPAEDFIGMFTNAGPNIITVQVEAARHIHRTLQAIRDAGIIPGVGINPGTPVCMLEPVFHLAGLVLVMTVNPGFGGQKFLPEVLPKIKCLVRKRAVQSLDFLIECDGGVNSGTAGVLVKAGCDVLVAGSAVYDSDDPARAAREIRQNAELEWRV